MTERSQNVYNDTSGDIKQKEYMKLQDSATDVYTSFRMSHPGFNMKLKEKKYMFKLH